MNALSYLGFNQYQSLKIAEELGEKSVITHCMTNIGVIYYGQGNYPKAIEYYTKSLKIFEEIADKSGIAASLGNIGLIYQNQGDLVKAIEYQTRSLKIEEFSLISARASAIDGSFA